ncbi:hypothetical protein [Clostridium beijerinckii]|jgi:hypothetical protein|uniref:hypothetical protein n=1 Tax=Clostridium beijerinckii TaxID=1520 RepID=UPI001ED6E3E3|nr:hypothetical protein [Clostridium beijerinckii]MCI1478701.1 hypothetical protein [Clostridium beijerinckii]MCI1579890.1 hypothetical protein [Clostridium beijerinckii]MCI1582194.1 hypothetical protein [Clostridium beijerinckii]MCI1622711.1 hypothetical protein [Clostridium beijerinckii]MDG5853899.1 hypothetical protein [Clostridium beijerinckii]
MKIYSKDLQSLSNECKSYIVDEYHGGKINVLPNKRRRCRIMTSKVYLTQAYRIDQRINSKIEQSVLLRELPNKAISTLSNTPLSDTRNVYFMEHTITKMIDLEDEINKDIDTIVDLKIEFVSIIKKISNPE